MKHVDFRTAHARLGNYPGRASPQAERVLFDRVMSLPSGSVVMEIGCEAGRETVMIGIAARNVGATVFVFENWSKLNPAVKVRFDWAIKTHGLAETVWPADGVLGPIDLLLVSREMGEVSDRLNYVKEGGLVLFLDIDRTTDAKELNLLETKPVQIHRKVRAVDDLPEPDDQLDIPND